MPAAEAAVAGPESLLHNVRRRVEGLWRPRSPKANAYCKRLIGTIRRECLDYLIPFGERRLKVILKELVNYYNRGRPHSALGPGIPEPPQAKVPAGPHRHKLPAGYGVASTPIPGGLHHKYRLEKEAA